MAKEITIALGLPKLYGDESLWLYNALDCAVTLEVWKNLQASRTPASDISYSFVSAMRGPALAMMLRGIRIDMEARAQALDEYKGKISRIQSIMDKFAFAVWDKPLNPRSPIQCKDFFYKAMNIPAIISYKKGERKESADRDTLEKLMAYLHPRPIIKCILALRDYSKKIEVLTKGLDEEAPGHFRMRSSFNVVGTETGRWSSSENAFGQGTNQQNITPELRKIFIADPGRKLAYCDLEQAESRAVAHLSADTNYILACESGDLHTTVAKMVWKNLPWSGQLAQDRALAEGKFYRDFSYRDMAKRLGHGSNYYGTPPTMAKHIKMPVDLVRDFQQAYFKAFPGIRQWHHEVAKQLQTQGFLTTALSRQRYFLGRRFDDTTLREAIAYEPQSIVAELLNLWLWRVFEHLPEVELLAQIHDAILIQYPKEIENEILPKVLALAKIPVAFPHSTLIIPASCEVGYNWGKSNKANPSGLIKWTGHDGRSEPQRARGILDRPISSIL